jgi:hypothetical protein
MQARIVQMLKTVRLEPEVPKTGGLGVKARNRIRRDELLRAAE